ncbi:MAG: DUF420 domain-containing protein [Planctomycetales bacterium]
MKTLSLTLAPLLLLFAALPLRADDPIPWDKKGISEFEFTDQFGKKIHREDLKGEPWIVGFIFTRCAGPCPRVTGQMNLLRRDTGVKTVTIDVDPAFDTPEVLAKYAETFTDSKPGDPKPWLFLTGDQIKTYQLIRDSFKLPVQEMKGTDRQPGFEVLHSTNIMLVNADLQVVGKYNAMKDEEVAKLRRILQKKDPFPPAPTTDAPPPQNPLGLKITGADGKEQPLTPVTDATQEKEKTAQKVETVEKAATPPWVTALPTVNASLNALALVLLLIGYSLIKAKRVHEHRNVMLAAFATSILFLACYLVYHFHVPSRKFTGTGVWRPIYFAILISHILLAATVPVLAGRTIWYALKQNWQKHKSWAKTTFPIWVYVSVTGVIIYFMLYHWPISPA